MRIKSLFVGAIASAAMLLAAGSVGRTQSTSGQPGRFQLLAGEHDAAGKTALIVQRDVFRIDTQTGATSVYSVGYDANGRPYAEWMPIK